MRAAPAVGAGVTRIHAGHLDRRLEILQPVSARSALGAAETIFRARGRRWATRLKFIPAELEDQAVRRTWSRRDYLLRLDSLTRQITTGWRVREGDLDAKIVGVDADPHDGSLILRCEQGEE